MKKLFEAWPSLKDYVTKNKKQLMDRTLLERRARKWVEKQLEAGGGSMDWCPAGIRDFCQELLPRKR